VTILDIKSWKNSERIDLPLTIIARIVGVKNAKYFNELWNKDDASRERVKSLFREAAVRFKSICNITNRCSRKEGSMSSFKITEEKDNKDVNGVFFGSGWSLRPTHRDAKQVVFDGCSYWIPKWCDYDETTGTVTE
jgi:hypothetical protein